MADGLFDRSDYISTFATHVSHEIKTPLTSIRGALELVRDADDQMSVMDRRRFLENALADTARMTLLLERLQELARADNVRDDGESSLESVLCGLRARFPAIELEFEGAVTKPVALSATNLEIVFSNLLVNAGQHDATRVGVVAEIDGDHLRVALSDNGHGVSAGNENRIFDLFFTTRRDAGGTGMGLGIVRTVLRAHGGEIGLIKPSAASGAAFQIALPLANDEIAPSDSRH